ncbi:MAG: DUF4212 domain-containing protein [Planctomycetes bacterium]|nr:DUF4212 domain-containing protein [Planctomycetota bacterium]
MSASVDFNTNFFSPKSPFARDNSRLISIMLVVWFVAIFGFQGLLKIMETPTPEPIHQQYEKVWSEAKNGGNIELAGISLNLMARYIPLRSNETLQKYITSALAANMSAGLKAEYTAAQATLAEGTKITAELQSKLADALKLPAGDIRADVISTAMLPLAALSISEDNITELPKIMDKHLIHNRSVLTDTQFLGFPFHYGYTAVFLLVLFVVICIVYCLVFDKISHKHGMEKD